ncbi:MAG: DUF2585 family protein [Deltaproteobacteria bacterium]|nr:DUF2585 family protein [Deltaproteobacteria bacterium]
MSASRASADSSRRARWQWKHVGFTAVCVGIAASTLIVMGRPLFCACGTIRLWYGDAWGAENSQQLLDPYSFTHITHGILFFALLRWTARRLSMPACGVMAVGLESVWEVIENTNTVIDRYRAATMALGYYGDSVLNSVGDILSCGVGFALAARLPTRATVAIVILLETALTFTIRDSLLLNIVMLVHPVEAIKVWQAQIQH